MSENSPLRIHPRNPVEGEVEMRMGRMLLKTDAIYDPEFDTLEDFKTGI